MDTHALWLLCIRDSEWCPAAEIQYFSVSCSLMDWLLNCIKQILNHAGQRQIYMNTFWITSIDFTVLHTCLNNLATKMFA